MNDIQTCLAHHGILGQKWGIRRFQNKDGSLTTAGKKRYPSKPEIVNSKSKPEIVNSKSKTHEVDSAHNKVERARKTKASNLGDDELRDYTNRLNAESNYEAAVARYNSEHRSQSERAKDFIAEQVKYTANQFAKKAEEKIAKRMADKFIDKLLGPDPNSGKNKKTTI